MELISRKLCKFLLMFSTGFTSLIALLVFPLRSPSSSLCTVFDSISSNLDEVLSINSSANAFVFGDFNVHHKDWLYWSTWWTLLVNSVIPNDLAQMVNFPTGIPDCGSHSPLWDLFLSSGASICSTMAFPSLGNPDHVAVSVSIDFPSNSEWNALFHPIAYDYSRADGMIFVIIWQMFHGRISLSSVLLLLLGNFVSGFRLELMYISLIENIRSSLTYLHGFQLLVLLP